MDNCQVRFVARCMEDPSKMADIMPWGVGDELAEEGEGRRWNDHGPEWVNKEGKEDRYVSTLTWTVSILLEGKPLWEGPCQKVNIDEVDLKPSRAKGSEQDPDDPDAWEMEIRRVGVGGALVFSDGSLLEGGGWLAAGLSW